MHVVLTKMERTFLHNVCYYVWVDDDDGSDIDMNDAADTVA